MRYINTSWVCDGFADCSSGADELPELCKSGSQTEEDLVRGRMISEFQFCSDSEYKCRDGKCIPLDYVCDLTRNCDDGSDEGGNCSEFLAFFFFSFYIKIQLFVKIVLK